MGGWNLFRVYDVEDLLRNATKWPLLSEFSSTINARYQLLYSQDILFVSFSTKENVALNSNNSKDTIELPNKEANNWTVTDP